MRITEVRIKLTEETDDRLQAFCSVTFDDWFVVRDLKIIEGTNGPFVAMPSRKLTAHCPRCGSKNHLRANYCNQCGAKQDSDRAVRDNEGRAKLYADIAHPINSECREMIQARVVADYKKERELSSQPGYVSRYEEEFDEDYVAAAESNGPATVEVPPKEVAPEKRERTIVEPAATEPRPPHAAVASDTPQKKPRQVAKRTGGFGSGILDD